MRTVLNALVKCLFSIGFIAVHFSYNILKSKRVVEETVHTSVNDIHKSEEEDDGQSSLVTADPRVSLLGPLPHCFSNSSNSKTSSSKTKYV